MLRSRELVSEVQSAEPAPLPRLLRDRVAGDVACADMQDGHKTAQIGECKTHGAFSGKTEPKKMERRRSSIASIAFCILCFIAALMVRTTEASAAAEGGYSRSTCMAGRKSVCHFDGRGRGISGNVGVMGNAGHSEYRLHIRDFSFPSMGKISALPTVTKGMIGAW